MISEAMMGASALKTAFDMAKGLKDISDAAIRNAAVIELQEKILAAQQAQFALVQRVDKAEKEMTELKAQASQKQRYYLKDFGGNTFAYELKVSEAHGEPIHRACPNCYQQGHISILQFDFVTAVRQDKYACHSCKSAFEFGPRVARQIQHDRGPPRGGWV